ncbi:MAG: thiol-activated cytolysin family protein [Cytophagales bacterium]
MKKFILSSAVLLIALSACKKKVTDNKVAPTDDLNGYLTALTPVNSPTPILSPQASADSIVNWNSTDGTYCKSVKYKLGPNYNEGFLLNPTSDVIFPGAIIDGNSIYDGSYRLISLPRTGGVITSDNQGLTTASAKVDETTKAEVQQAILDINSNLKASSGANFQFLVQDIYSSQQLDMHLGFTVSSPSEKNKVTGGFNFSSTKSKSRILIKFEQVYYSMNYGAKQKPADFFQSGVTPSQVSTTINGTSVAPVYVSNVMYGRLAYLTFESDMSQDSLKATLNAKFHAGTVKGDLDAKLSSKLSNFNTTIQGTVIGGSGADAVKAINGLDGIKEYILNGGEYSASSPGLPVAYTLRRISDNAVFNVVNISEYTVNQCYSTTGAITINGAQLVSGGKDGAAKIYGTIYANLGYDGESFSNGNTLIWSSNDWGSNTFTSTTGLQQLVNTTPTKFNLVYDPSKYEKAYLYLELKLTNVNEYGGLGSKKVYLTTDDVITKTSKVYLKDIINNSLGSDWAINNSQTSKSYDLKVNFPYVNKQAWLCKEGYNNCKHDNFDVSAIETNMNFNFSINVNTK